MIEVVFYLDRVADRLETLAFQLAKLADRLRYKSERAQAQRRYETTVMKDDVESGGKQ